MDTKTNKILDFSIIHVKFIYSFFGQIVFKI